MTHKYADQYMLRLPEGWRDRIKTAAAEKRRSMNSEILAALEEKFAAGASSPNSAPAAESHQSNGGFRE
jgi:hypothetical protein